jgi:hypothetical protein
VDIRAIDAHSTLIPLGLNQDDTVEVPDVKTPQPRIPQMMAGSRHVWG